MPISWFWDGCENGIDQLFCQAIHTLGRAGAVLKDKRLPEGGDAFAIFAEGGVSAIELRAFLDRELPDWLAVIDPVNACAVKNAENLSAREDLTRLARRREVARSVARRFDDVDVIAMPTVIVTPHVLTEESGPEKFRPRNRHIVHNLVLVKNARTEWRFHPGFGRIAVPPRAPPLLGLDPLDDSFEACSKDVPGEYDAIGVLEHGTNQARPG